MIVTGFWFKQRGAPANTYAYYKINMNENATVQDLLENMQTQFSLFHQPLAVYMRLRSKESAPFHPNLKLHMLMQRFDLVVGFKDDDTMDSDVPCTHLKPK